jgi:hypothetical protein
MSQKTPITVAHGDGSQAVAHAQISALYQKVTAAGYDIVKTETLRIFDGQQGFTLAQGR